MLVRLMHLGHYQMNVAIRQLASHFCYRLNHLENLLWLCFGQISVLLVNWPEDTQVLSKYDSRIQKDSLLVLCAATCLPLGANTLSCPWHWNSHFQPHSFLELNGGCTFFDFLKIYLIFLSKTTRALPLLAVLQNWSAWGCKWARRKESLPQLQTTRLWHRVES